MTDLPAPRAVRLARPRWLDLRLVLGLLLVLGSVVAGSRIVAAASGTVPVWSVRTALGAGSTLQADDLVTVDVHLGGSADGYVGGDAPVGRVLARPLGAGELVPATALAADGAEPLRRVVVGTDTATAAGLTRGSVVDAYAVPPQEAAAEEGAPPEPELVLGGLTVGTVAEDGSRLSVGGSTGVTLLVPADDVPALLAAQRSDEGVVLVQVDQDGDR